MNGLRCIALFCALALPFAAQAQYPSRPVRIVVGFPAGGPIDVQARLIGQKLSQRLGQPVIVDNRPGADAMIATQAVSRAEPDGHTLLLASIGFATVPALHAALPYDPVKSFVPVIYVASGAMVLVGGPSMPATDLAGLLTLARERPGIITYGSVGIGSSNHLGMELLARRAGAKMHHVPYKGAAPATIDLLAGRLDLMLNPINNALPEIRNGRLRPFAVSTRHRTPAIPDVPAIAETVSGYDVALWSGFFAPAGTPADVVAVINREIGEVLKAPDLQQTLQAQGFEVAGGTSSEFGAFVRNELRRWADLVAEEGIKKE